MAYYTKRLIPDNINRIEWIEQIVQLAKCNRAIYCVHWNRIMPAKALLNQQVQVLLKWIDRRLLFVYNTAHDNKWESLKPIKID